jgi:hypothetical protein
MVDLKVGDRIRIWAVPGVGFLEYTLHPETERVYRMLIKRKRPVRISRIQQGQPWYDCRFKVDGKWEHHSLNVSDTDRNWKKVNERNK